MEKNIVSIYKITNIINGKTYIGFDSKYPRRIGCHLKDSKRNKQSPLCEDIRKYGWDNFNHELLYQSWDSQHCLKVMENHFIVENNSYNNGYNRTLGGNGTLGSPRPKTQEMKKYMSDFMKINNPRKNYVFSKEEKENHSEKMKLFYENNPDRKPIGEKNGMFGKKQTTEWKKQHSETIKKLHKEERYEIKKTECVHCGLITTVQNIKRFHNEKCMWKTLL
jgi:group I intron endonuclease